MDGVRGSTCRVRGKQEAVEKMESMLRVATTPPSLSPLLRISCSQSEGIFLFLMLSCTSTREKRERQRKVVPEEEEEEQQLRAERDCGRSARRCGSGKTGRYISREVGSGGGHVKMARPHVIGYVASSERNTRASWPH